APARKNFSPSSPTAGIRLDLPVRQAYAQAAISPYVLGGTLTLFELGILSEPQRIGGRRLIPKSRIPEIVDALRKHGWLPQTAEAAR
ncbi:MAG: hypothetical protein WAU84_06625, partial [Thermoguttaceae bacterium]